MCKIMLVEDDPTISEIYKKKFESSGFEVACATTGKKVFELASKSDFDIVLLDMVLPEMNGMDVLKELKQSGKYNADMKVIVLSNLDKAKHEEEAKKNGADGFIGKTQYNPSELAAQIHRLAKEYDEQKKNKDRIEGKTESTSEEKKHILFIEDEEYFLEMFGKKLEDEGYAVDYAKNGAWGSRMVAEKKYDLIISDMVMPAMSGEEIIRRIKLDEKTKNIPIIVLSASVGDEEIKIAKELGIDDFYEKTKIVPSDLANRIAKLLN